MTLREDPHLSSSSDSEPQSPVKDTSSKLVNNRAEAQRRRREKEKRDREIEMQSVSDDDDEGSS